MTMSVQRQQPLERETSIGQGRQDFLEFFGGLAKTEDTTDDASATNNVFDSQQRQDFLSFIGKMNKTEDNENTDEMPSNVFDSVDFNNFLQQKLLQSKDTLHNNTHSIDFSMFKSKESIDFSMFKSKELMNQYLQSKDVAASASKLPVKTETPEPLKPPTRKVPGYVQQSQDWIKFNTLGQHVEVPYSTGMFAAAANATAKQNPPARSETSLPVTTEPSSIRTDFSSPSMMYAQNVPGQSGKKPLIGTIKPKKKRKRAPRKKIIPENKTYAEPTDKDVLMGRGGKSNHHPGNARYRDEVERLQHLYKKTDDKDEKTKISESLVVYVQSYGGNFLEKDEVGWYIIDDVVARRKVSQALREDKDPEKRRAKRQRFLAKRARMEAAKKIGV